MMATLRAESWEIDFCLSPLMSAAREWNQQPSYNHTAPSPSALTVWMSCSREEKSRRIISSSHSASTLPDHMDPLLNWKQPLPLGLLLSCLGVRPPLLFPLWKWCSVWLLCGFIWWHRSHKKMVKRREGGGLSLTVRWMPQVTTSCFCELHWDAGWADWGQREQLVHLFCLVEQTMALSELVTFPGLFPCSWGGCSCWYKPPPALQKISITANTLARCC